jgi:hypothetical protein
MRSTRLSGGLPVLAVIVAFEATPLSAQTRVTLDVLRAELAPNDSVSLVQTSGESVTGRLLRVSDTDLDVRIVTRRSQGQERRQLDLNIPFSVIQSLDRPRDSSRNGALIGAGVGAGFVGSMFVYAAAVDRNEIDEWGPIYLSYGALYTGLGALIGWAIDRAHSKPHIRYDALSSSATTIRMVPLLSRGPGIALALAF